VSGHGDSIRERRAQEIRRWEENEEEATKTTVIATTVGLLAAQVFANPEEAANFIEKLLEKRIHIEYLSWNGRTDVSFSFNGVC
jgi:hypothetical protein